MSLSIEARPQDFDSYWSNTMAALARLPAAPELTEMPIRSADSFTLYGLRLTSLDAYRIFTYYSVPHGGGPFPVIYRTPNYGSVVHVPPYEERQQYIVVSLCHRGQRLSDQPFAATYPGLLTTGIESPASYIYRGIVADCCRVIDFLTTRDEVDPSSIAVVGSDLALLTAAQCPQVDALHYMPGFFYAAQALAPQTEAYPLEELNEYARTYPKQAAEMWQTLAYFEAAHFAPNVIAKTLVVTGDDASTHAPLLERFAQIPETYQSAHSSYRDGVQQAEWIASRYGLEEVIVPEHWR